MVNLSSMEIAVLVPMVFVWYLLIICMVIVLSETLQDWSERAQTRNNIFIYTHICTKS